MKLYSPAKRIGHLLAEEFKKDPHFYFFSPDETTSNKFEEVFDVEKRAWALERKNWDLPEDENGRIIEMLSENVLFSVMTGHLMNNEKAMMGSYEAFFTVAVAQILQQMKFIKQSKELAKREPIPAVNLLSTSTCWRQDHNGYTHQSPAIVSMLLNSPSNLANCLFPIDDESAEVVFDFMLNSHDVVNLATFNKIEEPRYLDKKQAEIGIKEGAQICYDNSNGDPDIIFTASGDIVAREMFEAIEILKNDLPELKIRFVYISSLSYMAIGTTENKISKEKFTELFTSDKPIVANFHGYPETLGNILNNYTDKSRLHIHGFLEEGSTTTSFEMLRRNVVSRYDIAIEVAKLYKNDDLVDKYSDILKQNHDHAVKYGKDMIK